METTLQRAKKIGVISDEDHAKSVVTALNALGYDATCLGGNPSSYPPTLDVLVCRTKSCSHGASYLALEAKRKGMPVVIENGVTSIINQVNALCGVEKEEEVHAEESEIEVEPTEEEVTNSRGSVLRAIHSGLPYFLKIGEFTPTQIAEVSVAMGLVAGQKARKRVHMECDIVARYATRTHKKVMRLLTADASKHSITAHRVFYQGKSNAIYPVAVLAKQPLSREQLSTFANMLGFMLDPKLPAPTEEGELDLTPFRSKYYRCNFNRSDKRWRIVTPQGAYITQMRTREEAQARMAELDAELDRPLLQLVQMAEVAEPQPEQAQPEEPEEVVVQPALEVVQPEEPTLTPEEELEAVLRKARELMNRVGKRLITFEGFKAQVLDVHLHAPQESKCTVALEGEVFAKDITKVTCSHCKTTPFFKAAEFVLANLTIGD